MLISIIFKGNYTHICPSASIQLSDWGIPLRRKLSNARYQLYIQNKSQLHIILFWSKGSSGKMQVVSVPLHQHLNSYMSVPEFQNIFILFKKKSKIQICCESGSEITIMSTIPNIIHRLLPALLLASTLWNWLHNRKDVCSNRIKYRQILSANKRSKYAQNSISQIRGLQKTPKGAR